MPLRTRSWALPKKFVTLGIGHIGVGENRSLNVSHVVEGHDQRAELHFVTRLYASTVPRPVAKFQPVEAVYAGV